ncbi:MAG: NAD(P)-dependent oxidoreductase [Saprospiraceae bacterium]|nr:NAD(P)-dependent oxidoreductase [Saprospiraceae bacterium]
MTNSILILGGAGFLGKALAETLIRSGGYTVYSGDKVKSAVQGINNIEIDVLNELSLHKALRDMKVVINCTGQITRPIKNCLRLNSVGTANIAKAVTRYNIHLIHISSVNVYGTTDDVTTENTEVNPETPYGVSKAISEIIVSNGIAKEKWSVLRLCNLYGEEQTKGLLSYLIRSFNGDQSLNLHEDGYKCRYPIHYKDASEIIYRFLDQGPFAGIYNIKGPDMYSTRDLISMCTQITGKTLKTCFEEKESYENVRQLNDEKLQDRIQVKYSFSLNGYLKERLKLL